MSCAIFSLIFDARSRQSAAATGLALLNAVVIAAYTVIDGIGSRKSGAPVAYSLWLFLFIGVPWLFWALLRYRREHRRPAAAEIATALIGGACSLGSYTLALWAMTRAPIAAVAAVRETSIVFGTVLGAVILREHVTWLRATAVLAIASSVWIIRG
jgi:drug/metabolite transporter (DMT)-like permease